MQQGIHISGSLGSQIISSEPLENLFQMTSNEVFSGDPAYMPVTYVELALQIGSNLQTTSLPDHLMKINHKQFTPNYELEVSTLEYSKNYFQEQEEMGKLQEEKLKAMDEEEKQRIQVEQDRLAELDRQKREKQEELRKKWEQENREKEAKVKEMIAICGAVMKAEDAQFYLESQDWDMRQAIRFYYDSSGKQINDKAEVKFMLPDSDSVVIKEFKTSSTLWDVRMVASSLLTEKERQFNMGLSRGDHMQADTYSKTLLELGFVPSVHLYLDYAE